MNRRTFNKLIAGVFATPTAFLLGKPAKTVTMGIDIAKGKAEELITITGTAGYEGTWSVIHHDMLTGARTLCREGMPRIELK